MSSRNIEQAALDYILEWTPKSIDTVVKALTKDGPLPGKVKIPAKDAADMERWRAMKGQGGIG